MDFISYTFVNAVISALAVFGCWLILRPQKIENRALHKSIDNNTKALEDLTGLINEMRVAQASVETNITNLWHRYKDLKEKWTKSMTTIGIWGIHHVRKSKGSPI